MRYRPVDDNGDMMPVAYASNMLYDADAVAQAVNSRLRFAYG